MGRGLFKFSVGVLFFALLPTSGQAAERELRGGWYLLEPFQYLDESKGDGVLTGLDVELQKAIASSAGYGVEIEKVEWSQHQIDLKDGKRDIAGIAFKNPEREAYAHFSIPYRDEINEYYARSGSLKSLEADSMEELVAKIDTQGLRLGAISGYEYTDPAINKFIRDPAKAGKVVLVNNDYQNFENLLSGEIDGFFSDQIVASTLAWRMGIRDKVKPHSVKSSKPLHLMFSKKTVSLDVVEAFNEGIKAVKESGEYSRINKDYIYPILLSQTLDANWFFIIDIIGTMAFILSGLILAYRYSYDIFGAFVLASLPAVGGGVMRDLITNRDPIGVLNSPIYILLVIGMVVAGFAGIKFYERFGEALGFRKSLESISPRLLGFQMNTFDALGLSAFVVTGVVVALATRSEPLWLWGPILATITGAGGGILRDVVRSEPNIGALKGELYPEIAFVWGLFLSCFILWQTKQSVDLDNLVWAVIFTMAGCFVTRMVVMFFNLSSPLYRSKK